MAEPVQAPKLTPTAEAVRITWQPQPRQAALLACPFEDILFGGSRGGGKTDACLGKWAQRVKLYPKHLRGIFIRRTYDELDEVIARSMEIYPAMGAVWRQQRRTWYFKCGARIKFRALQRDIDASKYQGHSYTDVYIDEAGNFSTPDPLDKLKATLRNPYGIPPTFTMTANPGGVGHEWLKKRYVDPAPDGFEPILDPISGDYRIYIPSRLSDNKILTDQDPNYEKRIKQSGAAWLVQAWLNGDWNATPEGGLVKINWFKRYRAIPAEILRIVCSWDTAYKDGQENDPSVCTVWGETKQGFYLLDVFRKRLQYPELKRAVKSMAEKWKPDAVLIEDKASGQSLIQELRNGPDKIPVIAIQTTDENGKQQSKLARLIKVTSVMESGLVYIPEQATWLLDYELELTLFPLAAHDDQVDSTSQALKWMFRHKANLDNYSRANQVRAVEEMQNNVMDSQPQPQQHQGRRRSRERFRGY